MPKKFKKYQGYLITENLRERTISIYDSLGGFLSTVNEGELNAEIRRLENNEE